MLYSKYDGHCAFCGILLEDPWHISEINPINSVVLSNGSIIIGDTSYENLLPSCRYCNMTRIHNSPKSHKIDLEAFRNHLRRDIWFLTHNPYYQKALRYGMIKEVKSEIEFYFEKVQP